MEKTENNFNVFRSSKNLFIVHPSKRPSSYLESYVPNWTFKIWMYNGTDFPSSKEFVSTEELAKKLETLEPKILDEYKPAHDSGTGLGNNTVTSRFHNYNLFRETDETIVQVQNVIKYQIKKFLEETDPKVFDDFMFDPHINCWFNIMKPGEKINAHIHNLTNPFISGHFTVQCEDSLTYYLVPYSRNKIDMQNNVGEGIIFPSYIEHGTSIHNGKNNRISIAWDLYYNKDEVNSAIFENVEGIYLK